MKIPVFISAPTSLNTSQQEIYNEIVNLLDELNLERRALGKSDYPTRSPLNEICSLAKRCSGGLVLGFTQQLASKVKLKPGTTEETELDSVKYPTPWNQIEAGILFSLRIPLLVFKEDGIFGGIFDHGVADLFIHKMPDISQLKANKSQFRAVISKWQAEVTTKYYQD